MTQRDDSDLPGGTEAAAAEFALGLLTPREQAQFEMAMRSDPDLEQDVAAWSIYLASYTDDIEDVPAPPHLWARIEAAAFAAPRRRSLWQLLLPYVAGAIAASVLAFAAYTTGTLGPEPVPGAQGDVLLAHWAPESRALTLRRDRGDVPQDNAIEVWLMPGPGAEPVSLGLMRDSRVTQISVPEVLAAVMTPQASVALSLEPQGGSPTGAPTGPIIATGPLDLRD